MKGTTKTQRQIARKLIKKGWTSQGTLCVAEKSYGLMHTVNLYYLSGQFTAIYWSEGKNQLNGISIPATLENLEIVLQQIDSIVKNTPEYKAKYQK